MTKITELKNQCKRAEVRFFSEKNKASKSVFAWNDKVGIRATDSVKETLDSWGYVLNKSFKTEDIALRMICSLDDELESMKSELKSLKLEIETIGKKSENMKEFV